MRKRDTMVQYHSLVPAVEQVGRCPKLTRYKVIAGTVVLLIATLLVVTAVSKSSMMSYQRSKTTTSCAIPFSADDNEDVNDENDDDDHEDIENGSDDPDGQGDFVFSRAKFGKMSGDVDVDDPNLRPGLGKTIGHRHMKRRFPSAIVIGARKAGTRALLRFISLHPDVVTSRREPHFFDRYYDEGLDWYRQQMPYSYEGQVTIEKTPNYFVDWDVPERVYNFNSSIKLILIVRNPIDRAVSDYVQLKESFYEKMDKNGREKFYKNGHAGFFGSFEELAFDQNTGEINKSYAPIKRSLYCRHLEKWLNNFKMSQLLVVDGENIKVRPWEEMYKVEEFLGLSHKVGKNRFVYNETKGFYCIKLEKGKDFSEEDESSPAFIPYSERCLADSKGREHPVLTPKSRRKLRKFFKEFNRRFFAKIGREFDWE